MKLVVTMIARNEAERHLEIACNSVLAVCEAMEAAGHKATFRFVDDASDDGTLAIVQKLYGKCTVEYWSYNEPKFWINEGSARQMAYDWATLDCKDGDWVLSLDADETINKPELIPGLIQEAEQEGRQWVGLPLYEFWTPTQYRTDGFWFGTTTMRLYKWHENGIFRPLAMACGSEPHYVFGSRGLWQDQVHLLHWGYVRKEDRARKHKAYTEREGGHGHNNQHVNSIVTTPTLAEYKGWGDD
jgi:glycosyltransferase involved in cell wall biosynthesis